MTDKPRTAAELYDQQRVADFFRFNVRFYGNDWRALGWQSRTTQYRRFAILAAIAPLAGRRILDLGCGLGDLYNYFQEEGIAVAYCGYDLLPEMVSRARQRFPGVCFEVHDVLQDFGQETFDYILSSGAFNVNFNDNLSAIHKLLPRMLAHCTEGVAINFLSIRDTNRDAILFHYDPQEMVAFCKTFCAHVQLVEDYLPNDFTVYLYHNPPAILSVGQR